MGRSAIGKAPNGTLKHTRPEDAAAQVLRGTLAKAPQVKAEDIEDLIVGCAFPEAEQGYNLARVVALRAGLPVSVCGQTINRFCSSGLQAIATAANAIKAGQADVMAAGGVDFMSTIPMGGNKVTPNPYLMETYPASYLAMGLTAERVAERYGVTREMQDAFAVESHRKAAEALAAGKFDAEIIPVDAVRYADGKSQTVTFARDEGVRADASVEGLAKLKTVFKRNGTVTAGNASQMSDGASFVLLMSADRAKALGVKPLARLVAFAVAGVDPDVMGIGPVAAIPKALKLAGMTLKDIGLIELNEAFASQALACVRELGIEPEKVNVNGGAIALGHPLGCTGAFLTTKLVPEMARRNVKYGMVSMCIGGGMGAAGVFALGG
jgi:acetyl-CoA acyltransferase